MLGHLEPYLLMPSALTPTALLERAERIAGTPALLDALAGAADPTAPVRVRHTPLYDAWLLPWDLGAATTLHAHDGAHGAYVAVSGVFRETIATSSAVRERLVLAGERVAFRPGYTHRLAAVAGEPAVTLHLSSPPRPSGPCTPATRADHVLVAS
jgi:mannose-6-phosphate isomerase-like protein (cupin superfamily)